MDLMIVFGGLAVIICVAIMIGRVDAHARDSAWRRIATARRGQQQREHALRQCLDGPRCPQCPVNRYFDGW